MFDVVNPAFEQPQMQDVSERIDACHSNMGFLGDFKFYS